MSKPQNIILLWFTQIALALKHVHDHKVLHRDLKTQNVFLTKAGAIKLGDFGIAKCLSESISKASTIVGTPYFLAPEIMKGNPYSYEADIWALGVLLYELCSLKPPFVSSNIHGLAIQIVKGIYSPIPCFYSTELKDLIGRLLIVEPSKRLKIKNILSIYHIRSPYNFKKIEAV